MDIYIELGVRSVKDKVLRFVSERGNDFIIHLFEANYLCANAIEREIKTFDLKNVFLHRVAVSNFDGERTFYLGDKSQASATLFEGKRYVNYDRSVVVKCINFDKWLKDNISKDDYVCMSIDIEGAEYEILPEMIKSGSIDLIKEIEIEFHVGKFRGEYREKFNKVHPIIADFLRNKKFVKGTFYKM